MSKYSGWKLGSAVGCVTFLAAATAPASFAADRSAIRASAAIPASVEALRLDRPMQIDGASLAVIDTALQVAEGRQEVLVRLRSPSVARSSARAPGDRVMQREMIKNDQSAFMRRAQRLAPGASSGPSFQVVLNAVVMEVDAKHIRALATDPQVERISRVVNYKMDLPDTVPYITASAMQQIGYDGSGVKVAVLDSGIDYTHAAFGGGGTLADYEAAYGTSTGDPRNTTRDGLFPTSKVVEGYDFVGEAWPNGPLAPDDDPIDLEGHGTHVGDIIGGAGGVAPGVDLYAVKVCSAVSSSCSGVALIQGMEYAADPNGDGDVSDRVDVINMSLGSSYGQAFDDDLALAVNNASELGILTVASAGNSSDKPYVTGTPAGAITALSVAQTEVPSAFLPQYDVIAPASIAGTYDAVFQPWSAPLTSVIEAPMQYADGAGGNLNGCAAFAPGSLTGRIVLVDRGGCNFTLKIKNIGDAGGLIGIIGLIDTSAPFTGGDGGDRPIDIPGYMISLADSNTLKSGLPSTVLRFDPNIGIPLVGNMVGSSSRGPRNPDNLLKPEIGAPGASVSAIAGSGTGTGPFGGTSGAAPMVAGSAALILDAYPGLTPLEVKARLMNNGETDIVTDPFSGLAPISRIGGGEVRVLDAYEEPIAAWAEEQTTGDYVGSLSYGQVDVAKDLVRLKKIVRVRNYTDQAVQYAIKPTFRFADDEASGAVSFIVKDSVRIGPNRDATFPVTLVIEGAKLAGNAMNSGSEGANPAALTFNEFDGYLMLDDGNGSSVHIPWHVLPRKAADLRGRMALKFRNGFSDSINFKNRGVGTAQIDAYSLLATSPNMPQGPEGGQSPMPDIRAVGITTIPVPAGFCSGNDSFLWVFAINTWERQSHLLPVSHQIVLDTNRDGAADYVVLNRDLSGPTTITDGRQLSWVLNVATGSLGAFFFAEHATNTGNTALIVCGEQIGMNAGDFLSTQVNMDVYTDDFYFGGPGDAVEGLTVTPLGERYFGVPEDIAGKGNGTLSAYDFGAFPGNTEELGLMLFTNGDRGAGNRGGAVQEGEALLLMAP